MLKIEYRLSQMLNKEKCHIKLKNDTHTHTKYVKLNLSFESDCCHLKMNVETTL